MLGGTLGSYLSLARVNAEKGGKLLNLSHVSKHPAQLGVHAHPS